MKINVLSSYQILGEESTDLFEQSSVVVEHFHPVENALFVVFNLERTF